MVRPVVRSRAAIVITCVACLMVSSPRQATAQSGHAEVSGQVTDQKAAVLPDAAVTLTELSTSRGLRATTGPTGSYAFTSVPPGTYNMTVELAGFKRAVRPGVRLVTGERIRLDVVLEIGGLTETVTVAGDASLLRTETGSLGHVVSNEKIVGLPLNGRSFVQLTSLVPGVALPPGSAFPRINGGRPRTNEYLFDGVSVLQPEPGQVAFFPIVDAIREFKVETNSPPAEFGRFNGGVINLTTRSGSNELHGSAFEFFRHEALNARNFFAPRTADTRDAPLFRRNQFGFVLGGPIVRNRTFFFADYQGTRQRIGRVRISTVPTALQRQGVFTESVGRVPVIYDPKTTQPAPGGGFIREPFLNNTIPQSQIDPVARARLERYPLPTSAGTANNYRRIGNEEQDQHQYDVRVDHHFSVRDRLFGRFSNFTDLTVPVTPLPDGSGNLTAGAIGRSDTLGRSFATSYVHVFSDRILNEVRVGYTRRALDRAGAVLDDPGESALGIPGVPANAAFQNALPTFLIDGFQQLGSPASTFSDFRTDLTQIVDVISFQHGRHLLKAGVDVRWSRLDVIQPPSPTGSLRFSALFTDLPGVTGTGSSLASFLLGQVQDFTIDLQQKVLRPRAMTQEYFVQDDWKATDRLTVNAGLRYTLNFPSTELDDQGAIFNLESEQLEYLGQNGVPRSARALHKLNLGPRVGLAYRLTDRTVVRSGYGIVWIDLSGITTPFINPYFPFLQTVTERSVDNINPAFQLANGPRIAAIPLTRDAGLGQGVFTVDRDLGSGYVQQWNLSVQRELGRNLAFEIGYTGSKITHVGIPNTNINQLTVEQLTLGTALLEQVPNPYFGQIPRSSSIGGPTVARAQLLRPYPRFTTVSFYRNNVGDTRYHGVQVKLDKRFSGGHSFLVSYTRSKLLDDASSVFDATVLAGPVANYPVADSFNRELERDVSNGDIPNNLVAAFIYRLPGVRRNRLFAAILDEWELAGILSLQSALPLPVTQATNFNAFAGFGTQRPNRVGNPELPSPERTIARWFDTSAFAVAPQFTIGNSSRNPIRGPAFRSLDLALVRKVAVAGDASLEFRAEAFNVTNRPPLGAPNTVLGTPGFGSITSAGDPRVIQVAVKVIF